MNTEYSKSIITFNTIILKDNCNRQELSVADKMSPILPKKLKDSYNKNKQSMSKYIKSYFYKKNTL